MTDLSTHTLDRPGVTLTYDVRPAAEESGHRTLFVIGSPMGASGFPTLVSYLTDRTVVTYDPRGVERSVRSTEGPLTPLDHAEDLAAVIEAVGGGEPVDIFASSGGAVNAVALVASRPELVSTLVAHEPPLARILPDAEFVVAAIARVAKAYQANGFGAGMAGFIGLISHKGEFTAANLEQPLPDPAMFGMPADDDGNRNDPLLGQNLLAGTSFEPAIDKLSAVPTRIVVGIGEDSEGEMARRGGEALADLLVIEPVVFPGGHGGFQGNEYGMPGKPEEFAATLKNVLG